MNCTQRSGLRVREFLNSQDINDFVLPKHPMNMTDKFSKLQDSHALAPYLTQQWTDIDTQAQQYNTNLDILSPTMHSQYNGSLPFDKSTEPLDQREGNSQ